MSQRMGSANRAAAVLLCGIALLHVGACDALTGPGEPEEVRVTIESSDTRTIALVTSMQFVMVRDPDCPGCERQVQLVSADTSISALPFDRTYRFNSRQQFFVEASPPPGDTANLSMRVTIDGRVWYDDARRLLPSGEGGKQETLQFVYNFRQLRVD